MPRIVFILMFWLVSMQPMVVSGVLIVRPCLLHYYFVPLTRLKS